MIDPSRKREGAGLFALEFVEKVLNNTVGERKMVRYGDASYETAVDLVKYGPCSRSAP